jgi:ABC-type enterochelin transport system permease subunit
MKDKSNKVKKDRILLIGISLGIIYWLIDTFLYLISSYDPNILSGIFGPDFDRISTRIIVLCLFIVFGSHVQYSFKQRKWTESEFEKLKEKNEELQREVSEIKKK